MHLESRWWEELSPGPRHGRPRGLPVRPEAGPSVGTEGLVVDDAGVGEVLHVTESVKKCRQNCRRLGASRGGVPWGLALKDLKLNEV